jgi:hypothetical protein
VLRQLQAEIARIERAIGKLIDASPVFQAKAALLKSIPGVGDVVARVFIAELPELSIVDRHEIAALEGVAPINQDSGRWRGKRTIKAGRPSGAGTVVCRLPVDDPVQQTAACVLPPPGRWWERKEDSPDRGDAQAAGDRQCHAESQKALDRG